MSRSCLLCLETWNHCSVEPENLKIFHKDLNDEGLQQNKNKKRNIYNMDIIILKKYYL